ncbi:aromatic-ring-hydroxylating dioxygenase subunit beta [Sinorhizobium medicae]|uniref:aromatic-ring-hydroxylating dioxygenase subunit beta n=1 Tax=Sinorhizobium medicae TaxID=110321 RepID=UPI000FDC3766|nr:aromatic-ring-hydroxylating dioxygenase subunit beta [Sinorhizobium medicae]RVJ82717.1 hypothetical protein CN168_10965 [Sinorhizobium medicae]
MDVFVYLALAGGAYWYVRQHGELKFYIEGQGAFSKELDEIMLSHWEDHPPQSMDIDYELRRKLEDRISRFMDESHWPRFKAYDLMHTVQRNIKNTPEDKTTIDARSSAETRAYEIGKAFKQVIEQYDRRGKRYRDKD